jgi:threonine synthase
VLPPVSRQKGLSRFRSTFPIPPDTELLDLGEGGTPLLEFEIKGRRVSFKCEHLNPTGSFKDRGTVVLVSALLAAGVNEAVEDSSGNAGASFAAYAARAGISARVFVPDYASGPKRAQIEAYGAEVVGVPGPRSAASQAVLEAAQEGSVYASHAFLPHGLAGMATVAFELVEQIEGTPGTIYMPVGQGTLFLGIFRGFQALMTAGLIDRIPRLMGIQAKACAPLWEAYKMKDSMPVEVVERQTHAEGIRIQNPHRGAEILAALEACDGGMIAVEEQDILKGRDALGRLGLYVEPTSAVVWPAITSTMDEVPDPIVAVLTGSGFKTSA